jgi:hypothetical protein
LAAFSGILKKYLETVSWKRSRWSHSKNPISNEIYYGASVGTPGDSFKIPEKCRKPICIQLYCIKLLRRLLQEIILYRESTTLEGNYYLHRKLSFTGNLQPWKEIITYTGNYQLQEIYNLYRVVYFAEHS